VSDPLSVAFLGDDYTAGRGASAAGKGFVPRIGDRLHVTAHAFGTPGAGYAKRAGHPARNYLDLVPEVVAAHPDVVVVSGGRNDVADPPSTFRTATRDLFAILHTELPDAVLVAVAPWWGDSPHPRRLRVLDAPIRDAVQAAGGHYLDLPDPLVGHPNWMADDADPDDAGYAALARTLAPALRPLLPGGGG
jgi:acyl-CoA thioesterase-1